MSSASEDQILEGTGSTTTRIMTPDAGGTSIGGTRGDYALGGGTTGNTATELGNEDTDVMWITVFGNY